MRKTQFMLFVGTAHDAELRRRVAKRAREAGFQVDDEDGPFGTVVVAANDDDHTALAAIEEVTSVCTVPTAEEIEQSIAMLEQMAALRKERSAQQ
ncbi:MAG TPA: hypothetical protein V6D17_21755 [Candidatus Obscuribacterales bacterium]